MRYYKLFSFLLALVFVLPAVLIPAYLGVSLPEGDLETRGSEAPDDTGTMGFYMAMELYYIFFVLTNLLPFTFFVFWSTFVMWKQKRRADTTNGNGSYPTASDLFKSTSYPRVSVIIPCYNESRYMSAALSNCYRQTYRGELEIIVVDDGSKDSTWSISRLFKGEKGKRTVKVFHKENGGKASALSYGIKQATGKIIIMTDGDSQMNPNGIAEIVSTFRRHPDAGIVGGFISIRNTHTGYLTKLQQLEYVLTQHTIRMSQSDDGSVLIAPGPIFGMRADLARALPPLDRTVVEDCDLTMSVLSTGWTTRSTVRAISYTTAPETWSIWLRQRRRWIYGQFQAWRENRWHLKRNPWGLYTYFTWFSTSLSTLILIASLLSTTMLIASGYDYYAFLEFISVRTAFILGLYLSLRAFIMLQYPETRRLLHYIPLKVVYDLVCGFLTAYLYFRYISRIGVKLRWGQRHEVVY